MKKYILHFSLIIQFLFIINGQAAISTFMFKHLSTEDGLSNNNINHIFKDSRGFLWIGTSSGLNRYDGHTFQQYYKNTCNLLDDYISEIFEDPYHNIWIRMPQGYSIYNYKTGEFYNNHHNALEDLKIPSKQILRVGSSNNEFWAYDSSKLFLYNTNSIKIYPISTQNISRLCVGKQGIYAIYPNANIVYISKQDSETKSINIPKEYINDVKEKSPRIYVDNTEGIWVYTSQNSILLHKKDLESPWEKICLYGSENIPFNRIQQIQDLGNGHFCILTSHLGLFILNKQTRHIDNLCHISMQPHTLASNNLTTSYLDNEGNLWIGHFKHGISYYSPMSAIFISNYTTNNDIVSLCKSHDSKTIYYGTDGNGLICQSLEDETTTNIKVPANIIVDLNFDREQNLWMGTFQNGLIKYHDNQIQKFTKENSKLLENDVYTLEIDKYGLIWIGTLRGYIQKFNPQNNEFETILYRPGEFSISDMFYDHDKSIYVATSKGLIHIDIETNAYSFINGFKEEQMLTVYKDSRGLIWVGHPHGLSILDSSTNSINFIESKDGLTANFIKTIIEDNYGQMWIGTGNGTSRIKMENNNYSIINYSAKDGLICNDANVHATIKLGNGNILIGTPKGLQTIVPQEIIITNYNATPHLTDIQVDQSSECILNGKSIEYTDEITVTEKNNTLILSFSALNLTDASRTKYAYKIGDNHSQWFYAEENRINLSMLPVGKYSLSVKVCNPQKMWSPNIKTLQIKVLPPWYQSRWAYLLYLCIIAGFIFIIIRHTNTRKRQKQILLSIEEENKRQQELSNMKLQFFANISHELRTPLSLVINPLEEFLAEHPEHRENMLDIAKKNALYLLELINQLLDFRRLDANAEKLKCKHDNILIILSEIFHSFDPVAHKRHITYTFQHHLNSLFMDFDYDKIRKITTNILSNAFKFTPNHGSISVSLEVKSSQLILSFADTGCGIEDEAKDKVFLRFYQSNKNNSSDGGSGIGLHIVSEYVKMHQGTICIKDNKPTGAIFQITLPLHQDMTEEAEEHMQETGENALQQDENRISILLVDDNADFLKFLSESLAKQFYVLNANNGEKALKILEKEDVDLIVSDVMMPKMDGLELCTAIKNDIRYSHIPIILLTAKASEEHLLEGLSVGADDYITKPFNMEILKLRINKIIEMNTKRIETFKNEIKIDPSKIAITPLDQQLIEKAIQIVEKNISESEFSVEELAAALNLSRSYFYKKMIKITGKKPLEFIRTIRMKRAKQLLSESQMQVAEIAYMLGYNSPKIFSRHFKEEFNVNPSIFKKEETEKATDCATNIQDTED